MLRDEKGWVIRSSDHCIRILRQGFDDAAHDWRRYSVAQQADFVTAAPMIELITVRKSHGGLQFRHLQHSQGRLACGIPLDQAKPIQGRQRAERSVKCLPSSTLVGTIIDNEELDSLALGSRRAFVSELSERLRDSGEMPDLEECEEKHIGQRGRRLEIDAYAFDDADDSLHLVAAVMDGGDELNTITLSDAREASFNRLQGVFEQARSGWLTKPDNLEESRPLWSLARQIERRTLPSALRLHVLTDRRISERLRLIPVGKTSDGLPIDYQRTCRASSESTRLRMPGTT
jgi:hypothetical protein